MVTAAAAIYVVTPTLPGRLADEVDRFRHIADERLDVVLGQMRSIDAPGRRSCRPRKRCLVIADAVADFKPAPS